MLPFSVTIPVTVPQRAEIQEGLMNNPVYTTILFRLLIAINCLSTFSFLQRRWQFETDKNFLSHEFQIRPVIRCR
jgi:hypothetical protein